MKIKTLVASLIIATSAFSSALLAKTVVVSQKDKAFDKKTLSVKLGDTIVFKNDDPFPHNVYSLSPGNTLEIKSQAPKGQPGSETPVVLEAGKFKAGTMDVECAIHPGMKLKVTIE